MKEEFFKFKSAEGKTDISAKIWGADIENPIAILQIVHGMNEYKERYNTFATWLNSRGFIVCANDHLGHGYSVPSNDQLGQMNVKNPSDVLVADIHSLRQMMTARYKGVPYFILGHSMGSYLLRKYLAPWGEGLAGAIIMGTGQQPKVAGKFGVGLTKIFAAPFSWNHRSKLIPKLTHDKNYRKYDVTGTDINASWLTKDSEVVEKYYNDPKCTFEFSLSAYRALFEAVAASADDKVASRIPEDLPMLVISGSEDPVGAMGEGVKKAFSQLVETGHTKTSIKIFEGDRHEILNETNKEEVFKYIFDWMILVL